MAAALTMLSIKAAFFALGPADSAVLAALGNGANSWIEREQLRQPHPTAPFVAVAYGGMTGQRQDVRTLFPTLWLYDDPAYRWTRINALAALIEAVYLHDCIAYCYTNYASGIGDEITDQALKRPALALRYQVRARF